jgi:YegS/Rv2252/BmrU family lipid kinase
MQAGQSTHQSSASHGRAVLFVNSKSRTGAENFDAALANLRDRGVDVRTAVRTKHVRKLLVLTEEAIKAGEPLVIIGGGDGTMNAVAGLFVNSQSTLGLLPMGTGNALARDLAIPVDINKACEIAIQGQQVKIDLGKIGDGYFVNVATVGLTTGIAQNLTDPMKRRFGRLVYVAALIRAFESIKPFHAVIKTENGEVEIETLQIVIGNGRFHAGPFPILPDANIREGKLSLYAIEARTKAELLKFALFLPGGRHVQLSEVHSQHCFSGSLTTRPNMPVTIDGQLGTQTPIQFTTVPGALSVMAGNDMPE